MKLDCGLDVCNRCLVSFALAHNHTSNPQRVGHIPVRMLFDDNLDLLYVMSVHAT